MIKPKSNSGSQEPPVSESTTESHQKDSSGANSAVTSDSKRVDANDDTLMSTTEVAGTESSTNTPDEDNFKNVISTIPPEASGNAIFVAL